MNAQITTDGATGGRRATPRPTYAAPTVIRRHETAHHVWGDAQSGLVTDRVYVSSGSLHVLEFELAPGGEFRHSASNRTIFAADVAYYVLDGTLVMADPEHGEVRSIPAGEALLFGRDTWHHGYNPSQQSVRVLEFFAPPPSQGTASTYARNQPMLAETRYHDARWDRRWPADRAKADATARLHQLRVADALWSFAQDRPSHLTGTLVDTKHLHMHIGRVAAGHVEDARAVTDETLIVAIAGALWVDLQDGLTGTYTAACLEPGDAAYVPVGSALRVLVRDGAPATYVLGSGRPVPDGWTP